MITNSSNGYGYPMATIAPTAWAEWRPARRPGGDGHVRARARTATAAWPPTVDGGRGAASAGSADAGDNGPRRELVAEGSGRARLVGPDLADQVTHVRFVTRHVHLDA